MRLVRADGLARARIDHVKLAARKTLDCFKHFSRVLRIAGCGPAVDLEARIRAAEDERLHTA